MYGFLGVMFACLVGLAAPVRAGTIAVVASADVEPYARALQGFKETAAHHVVAQFDMQGDFARGRRILQEVVNEVRPDLILAMGVWALQLVAREPIAIPVVFAMVFNPPSVIGGRSTNITGASMNVSVDRFLGVIEALGNVRRIGAVYNPQNTDYLAQEAAAHARTRGLVLDARPVSSAKDAIRAIKSLQGEGVDALWIFPDETVLDPGVVEYALITSYRSRIPLLGLSERHAEMGALLSVSFGSSEDIGRQAGELANEILSGRAAERLPFTMARTMKLVINLKAAEKLGMQIPPNLLAQADTVIR